TKSSWTSEIAFSLDGRTLVSGHNDGSVHVWEIATRKERICFEGHRGAVRTVAISRDGRSVASGSEDTTVLVWDATSGAPLDSTLSAEQLRRLWHDLKDGDAGRAARSMWRMALSPKQALPFLIEHLHPVVPLDAAAQKRADQLLTDLDSDQFAVRQEAE